jgi:hypothetical protein
MTRNRLVEMRLRDMLGFDCLGDWEAWQHLPFELWPCGSLLSYLADTGQGFAGDQPTAIELRAIVAAVTGCAVVPGADAGERVH